MSYADIPAGNAIPDDFFTVIEIPANHLPIKYEVDKPSGQIFVLPGQLRVYPEHAERRWRSAGRPGGLPISRLTWSCHPQSPGWCDLHDG